MDGASVIGVLLSLVAVVVGNQLEGGSFSALVNGPAFLIVAGGTLGATLLQFPPKVFWHGLRLSRFVLVPQDPDLTRLINKIMLWSGRARKEGMLGLEHVLDRERDALSRIGLQLLVDGNESEAIRSVLALHIDMRESMDLQACKIFDAMGGYAPTTGILGTIIGLIQVMNNLEDPVTLGGGIAVAFVSTIYGVVMANLLFLPMANKLKWHVFRQSQTQELVMEGILAIAEGENPRNIELKLNGYLASTKA
ncbi:MAG: flagellar motor protein [Methylococcales bacterium]|nr:flagellar motor protein [Methylococcales bacterium]